MKPLHRKPVSKSSGSKSFSKHASKTKAQNIMPNPMRGGIRL